MSEADTETRFCVNSPDVLEESVGGEVLIINLASGAYYSSDKAGEAIWRLLADHATSPEIVSSLLDRFEAGRGEIENAVREFKAQCLAEGLIVPAGPGIPAPATTAAESLGMKQAFDPPVLQKFTDMADLLLLDPIHEVGEAGWPQPREA